jgi:hypothetical protein
MSTVMAKKTPYDNAQAGHCRKSNLRSEEATEIASHVKAYAEYRDEGVFSTNCVKDTPHLSPTTNPLLD